MFRSSQTQYHPIGMDVGADAVKLVQLRTGAGVTEVAAAARLPLPQGEPQPNWVRLVRSGWRRARFVGRRVTAALPKQAVHVRSLRLSAGAGVNSDDLMAGVEREAALTFPFPLTPGNVAYLPAGEVRQAGELRHELVAVATSDHDVHQFLNHLHRAGLEADSLDVAPCALYRTACRADGNGNDPTSVRAVLDLGASAGQLVIGRGPTLSIVKNIDGGGRQLDAALSRRLEISLEDARALRHRTDATADETDRVRMAVHDAMRAAAAELIEQVLQCLRYHAVSFRGAPPQHLWITGGEASSVQVRALLAAGLGLPVEPLPVLMGIDPGALRHVNTTLALGEWAVAIGLAARSLPAEELEAPVGEVCHV